ncbi:MAG: metallophosphoesterase, partial [Actinomycetota bacterium]|nr:metallophosphoesterase [Actinomycetota bacterium]
VQQGGAGTAPAPARAATPAPEDEARASGAGATSPAADASATGEAAGTAVVVTFAGDIAAGTAGTPQYVNAMSTGDLIRRIDPAYALTGGDNAYQSATATEIRTKYEPTWGSFRAKTRPVPGNHEYKSAGAQPYYDYFFGGTQRRYYAFSPGAGWRFYMLNCEIDCGRGSTQENWLRRDLAAHPGMHFAAVLHRPRFSSGAHGSSLLPASLWTVLERAGGDIVLSGHDHHYERFAKQDASGRAFARGLRQFVVGTGGARLYDIRSARANSEKRLGADFGVLKLTLAPGRYSWAYVASGRCEMADDVSYDCPDRGNSVLDSGAAATNNAARS